MKAYPLKLLLLALLPIACVSTAPGTQKPDPPLAPMKTIQNLKPNEQQALTQKAAALDMPEWIIQPPSAVGYVYGMGMDTAPKKAQLKALSDMAWQISTQVNSVTVERSRTSPENKESTAASVGKQMAQVGILGAKIVDEYQSKAGETWVLMQKNLACTLDVAQRVLVMYSLDLEMESTDVPALLAEAELKIAAGRVENFGLETLEEVSVRAQATVASRLPRPKPQTWEEAAQQARNMAQARIARAFRIAPQGFTYVEGGTFLMGSPSTEIGRSFDEGPQHPVTLHSFYMGRNKVSHREFLEFLNTMKVAETGILDGNLVIDMRDPDVAVAYEAGSFVFKGSAQAQSADTPVMEISWYGAIEYANWLSRQQERSPAYIVKGTELRWNKNTDGFRLPTEAEWEYAARGGQWSKGYIYSGSNTADSAGWYRDNSGGIIQPFNLKTANELELRDMSGNLWEWCWDWYGSYSPENQTNPTGPLTGTDKILRGGSWNSDSKQLRSSNRGKLNPGDSGHYSGFRLVLPVE